MALILCRECGAQVSQNAKKCEKCGAPVRNNKKLIFWICVAMFFIVIAGGCQTKPSYQHNEIVPAAADYEIEKINKEEQENESQ